MSTLATGSARPALMIAAVGYVALFLLAIFANFFVRMGLIDPTDATKTIQALQEQEGLFRLGLGAFALIFVIDILIAWALYVVFEPASRSVSMHAAWFRLTYSVLLAVATVFLFLGLEVATSSEGFEPGLVTLMLSGFEASWLIGLIAFGMHLVLIGVMIIQSQLAPRLIGLVLVVAGVAYVVDSMLHLVLVDYAAVSGVMLGIVGVSSIVAELTFTIYLILAAVRSGRFAIATNAESQS